MPDAVRSRLAEVQQAAERAGVRFRWARVEGLHVTLVFLGERPAQDVPGVLRAVGCAADGRPALRLAAQGLGCFPALTRPRVVWAGLDGDLAALHALWQAVGLELERTGIPFLRQPFRPHITLGRSAGSPSLAEVLRLQAQLARPAERFGAWTARSVQLVHSQLGRGGSVYATAGEATLGAAPAR